MATMLTSRLVVVCAAVALCAAALAAGVKAAVRGVRGARARRLIRELEATPAPPGLAAVLGGMHGVYINLDSRPDRRARLEGMLAGAGLAAERFAAIKHYRGHIGCNKSHLAVLQAAHQHFSSSSSSSSSSSGLLVWEDDAAWNNVDHVAARTVPRLAALLRRPYDVILLCASGSAAYIVAPHYVGTLADNLAEGTRRFEETGDVAYAYDRHWNTLRNRDAWYVVHLVRQMPGYSDTAGYDMTYPREYVETPVPELQE